ncbi:retrovirus-related pol polyprotein from transposon TNT 1-94 [Tanacetum coccineum]
MTIVDALNSLAAINDYKSMEQSFVDENEENLKLQIELDKKNDMIEKAVYNELLKRCSRLENQCISLEIKLQQNKESFQTNRPSHNQDAPEFKEFFIINELQAQLEAKNVSIAKLKEHIAKIKGKNVVESVQNVQNSNVHSVLNANSELVYATCPKCMFHDIHDLYVNVYIIDVNARVKSKFVKSRSAKSKKKEMWKPIGKVNTKVRYIWKPTGWTFTIVENTCPLTRIISNNVVPPRKSISATPVKQTQPSSNKSGKPKDIKHVGRTNLTLIAKIMGYGDYQLRNVIISRVYYIEGLGQNLFSVGQLCDSDLEVAFRKHTCYVRHLDDDDLVSRSRDINLYTISLDNMLKSSRICLLSKSSKTKSWLWNWQLSYLNFGTLNQLAKQGLVRGLPKLKFKKDHLCSACSLGKSKKSSHKSKANKNNQEKLYLLHMNLCGPMHMESINGKKYILVIVDDYSRFTWVKFLRSKDEAPGVIIKCLKHIKVYMNATV